MTRYRSLVFAAMAAGVAWVCFLAISPSKQQHDLIPAGSSNPIGNSQLAAEYSSIRQSDRVSESEPSMLRGDDSLRDQLFKGIVEAEKISDPARYEIRAETWQRLVAGFAARDLENVFRELCTIQLTSPTDSGHDLQLRILQRLSEHDIRAAANALAEMQPADRPEACERVATQWTRQNREEAVAWARLIQSTKDRQSALAGIAAEAVADHPAEVLMLASEFPLPPERQDIISLAASRWASIDSREALSWARLIPDSPLRQEVFAAVAVAWADQDAKAAARLVVDSLPVGPGQENALVGIVQRLASKDISVTETWVAQFPAGPLRERAQLELRRIVERR